MTQTWNSGSGSGFISTPAPRKKNPTPLLLRLLITSGMYWEAISHFTDLASCRKWACHTHEVYPCPHLPDRVNLSTNQSCLRPFRFDFAVNTYLTLSSSNRWSTVELRRVFFNSHCWLILSWFSRRSWIERSKSVFALAVVPRYKFKTKLHPRQFRFRTGLDKEKFWCVWLFLNHFGGRDIWRNVTHI